MFISVALVCDMTESLYQNVNQATASFIKKVLLMGKKSKILLESKQKDTKCFLYVPPLEMHSPPHKGI